MYLSDKITDDALEEWANFIECRDDLDYEVIEGYIYKLANPYLIGDINKEQITKMVQSVFLVLWINSHQNDSFC